MVTTLIRWLGPAVAAPAMLVLAAAPASAHAELAAASPEPGSELEAPPDEVVLVFDGELDPESSGFVVTDAGGTELGRGEVDLEVAERNQLRGAVEMDEAGEVTVAWSVAAADGHPDEGSYTFTVVAAEDGADDGTQGDGAPDTAMPAGKGSSPLVLVGLVLVLAAAGSSAARLRPHGVAER